jgi:hypothetical protein
MAAARRLSLVVALSRPWKPIGQEQRRDDAYAWGIFQDITEDGRFLETFLVESWLEYLRQHERATRRGRALDKIVKAFSRGGEPVVSHLIAPERDDLFPIRPKRAWRQLIFRKRSR